jgi:hypothetical protein
VEVPAVAAATSGQETNPAEPAPPDTPAPHPPQQQRSIIVIKGIIQTLAGAQPEERQSLDTPEGDTP